MQPTLRSGNDVCYLDGRPRVGDRVEPQSMIESSPAHAEPVEARWFVWARSLFAVLVVVVLVGLGVANVAMYSQWHEVEDGVYWGARAEGVTATEIVPGSAAAAAGLERGDVLLAVNGSPAATRGGSLYFVLAAVGLFTLMVGASVRLRRPRDQATLHFFWLCVAFFGVFTFSFTGPLDRLDWVFYWGDAVAFALLPPLLLHFTMVFPERPEPRAENAEPRTLNPAPR